MTKIKIPRIKPPREQCKNCRGWLTQKDVGFNDIPHCVYNGKFEAHQYLLGIADKCFYFDLF